LCIKIASLYGLIEKLYHNNLGVPVIMTHRVLTAVDGMINNTTAYDKIPLIGLTVLHCDIYLVFKILIKFSSRM